MNRYTLNFFSKVQFRTVFQGLAKRLTCPLGYAVAALLCIVLESVLAFDVIFQSPFFHEGNWLLSKAFHNKWKMLLYTTPKIIIGVIGGVFLFVFIFSLLSKKQWIATWRKPALLVSLAIASIPLCVATMKIITGVYSPVDLLPYGGKYPHIGFIEQVWMYGQTAGGRGFPAGHASGGFALMALYYLPVNDFYRKILFFIGFFTGWSMGLYQMARGEHFLSHTLTSMLIALLLIVFIARRLRLQ